MTQHKEKIPVSGFIILIMIFLNALIAKIAFIRNENWYWALVFTVPILLIAIFDMRHGKQATIRNYPLLNHILYFFKRLRV